MSLTTHILRMAARTIGVSAGEAAELDTHEARRAASTACYKLAAKGKLHRAQLGPKSVRYFANPAFRDAHLLAYQQEEREKADAAARADDGFRPVWAADAVAVVPVHVKVQRCPGFAPRFQEADRILPGIVSFGLQRGRVTIDEVELAMRGRRTSCRSSWHTFLHIRA